MNYALESALSHFKKMDGELYIGDRSVTSLAEEYGTPLYIYDQSCIKRRQKTLNNALPKGLQVYYAVKANPNPEIIRIMGELYDGFDIASKGEMERAMKAGISQEVMSFTGPGKSIDELKYAIQQNIGNISIESEREVEHIQSICETIEKTTQVLIRVNPSFYLSQSGMKMGGGPKQFGIDSDRVPMLIDRIKSHRRIQFRGIHIFSGSQNLHADQLVQNFSKILDYAVELATSTKMPLKIVNIGGGFGIPYFAHEQDLDLTFLGDGLKKLFKEFKSQLPGTIFRVELGRFLVGESGIYLSRILYRKVSHNKVFLITNGGMHHHLAASGNFGQSLVRRPMPLVTANRLNDSIERVSVVGPLCTPLDTFGDVDMPQADEGDLVAVLNSGAYGFSASPLAFLSHKPPLEIVI